MPVRASGDNQLAKELIKKAPHRLAITLQLLGAGTSRDGTQGPSLVSLGPYAYPQHSHKLPLIHEVPTNSVI